jgi:uncharacterized cupin superfamily protein
LALTFSPRETLSVRYVRIYSAEDGGSRFEDIEVQGEPTHIVDGVPPLLVSGPFPVHAALFVAQPKDATDWRAHVSPRRQWAILLSGRVAVTTTDGERREFGPGDVILAEDTTGQGHLSTPLTADVTFVMLPVMP